MFSPSGPEICAQRIAQRKSTGGHGRPELAGELYESALSAVSGFSPQCDYTFLTDVTEESTLVAWLQGFHTTEVLPVTVPQ